MMRFCPSGAESSSCRRFSEYPDRFVVGLLLGRRLGSLVLGVKEHLEHPIIGQIKLIGVFLIISFQILGSILLGLGIFVIILAQSILPQDLFVFLHGDGHTGHRLEVLGLAGIGLLGGVLHSLDIGVVVLLAFLAHFIAIFRGFVIQLIGHPDGGVGLLAEIFPKSHILGVVGIVQSGRSQAHGGQIALIGGEEIAAQHIVIITVFLTGDLAVTHGHGGHMTLQSAGGIQQAEHQKH